jgi:hypothetical protein
MVRHIVAVILCLLAGCGTPGAPQPPSLYLPKPVEDLSATRRGNRVNLAWTMPRETTDGESLRGTISVRVCRGFRTQAEKTCNQIAADVPYLAKIAAEGSKQNYTDDLTPLLQDPHGRDFVNYSVEVLNDRARSAGPSNAQTIFLAPTMPPPAVLRAEVEADAIVLAWDAQPEPPSAALRTRYSYRLLRTTSREKEPAPVTTLAEFPPGKPTTFRDTNFDWQRTYVYQIVGVTQVLSRDGQQLAGFDGDASPPVTVFANDKFAPAVPQDLQAVYSGAVDPTQNFIDLTWSPNLEADLAGYNVYRSEPGGILIKLSQAPVPTPSFRDANVKPGGSYTYFVTAVDARGNESARSQPATESIPQRP